LADNDMTRLIPIGLLMFLISCIPNISTPITPDLPTAAPSQTPTIVWFPPTDTPKTIPTLIPSPTEDLRPGQGEIIFQDVFDDEGDWSVVSGNKGSATVVNGRLTLALSEPNTFLFTTRQAPVFNDFYLEITANPKLCRGADEYGLLVRVTGALEYYRFSLSCDGRARVDRFYNGQVTSVVPWTANGVIPTAVPSSVRLGVWALKGEIRFFVNEQFLFSVRDPLLYAGTLGVFVRTSGETPVTVSFTDLVVRGLME
jgi:hypothetical protein